MVIELIPRGYILQIQSVAATFNSVLVIIQYAAAGPLDVLVSFTNTYVGAATIVTARTRKVG
jgi:hypothetical protein